jgi:hypothetical protein
MMRTNLIYGSSSMDPSEHLAPSHVHDGKGRQHTAHPDQVERSIFSPTDTKRAASKKRYFSSAYDGSVLSLDRMNRNARAPVASTIGTTTNHESPTKKTAHILHKQEKRHHHARCPSSMAG